MRDARAVMDVPAEFEASEAAWELLRGSPRRRRLPDLPDTPATRLAGEAVELTLAFLSALLSGVKRHG